MNGSMEMMDGMVLEDDCDCGGKNTKATIISNRAIETKINKYGKRFNDIKAKPNLTEALKE